MKDKSKVYRCYFTRGNNGYSCDVIAYNKEHARDRIIKRLRLEGITFNNLDVTECSDLSSYYGNVINYVIQIC